jgi:hypothetical protein
MRLCPLLYLSPTHTFTVSCVIPLLPREEVAIWIIVKCLSLVTILHTVRYHDHTGWLRKSPAMQPVPVPVPLPSPSHFTLKWKRHCPLKRWYPATILHGITTQKTTTWIFYRRKNLKSRIRSNTFVTSLICRKVIVLIRHELLPCKNN